MEGSILVEENHQTSDSDIVSKSVGSSIKIDSISIDLVSNDEIDAGKCEHFSIRGYVSEIRKKNWKICWPFAFDGNHDRSEEQTCTLPPLHVSKFRWWRCQSCLQEIGAENIKNNNENAFNYCSTRFKSSGTCSHMSSLGDAAILKSDYHQAPKLNILEGRKVDASIVTDRIENDCLPSCNDKKEKKSESANTLIIEHEIGLEDNVSQDIPASVSAATAVIPGLVMGRNHADDTAALETNCNGSDKFYQPASGCYETADNELANKNLKCLVKNSTEICQTEKQLSAEDKHLKVMITCGTSGIVNRVDEVLDADKNTNGHPSLGFDECDNASSESAEILAGYGLQDHHHDNSSGSYRRKTRKVRLLTELLAENGDANTNQTRDENFPSNSVPDASEVVAAPAPQSPLAVEGNITRGFDQNRKRRFPCDEDCIPLEISSPNNFYKKDRTCDEGAETIGGLASSDSEEGAGIGLQIGIKNHLNKFRLDRSPTMDKKKNKKNPVVDEFLSLAVPSREKFQKDVQNKAGDANKVSTADIVLSKSAHTTFTSRGMYPFPLPPQKSARNSDLCKKKSKVPPFDDGQASLIPCMLRRSHLTRKDIEIMQMPSLTAPFQSAEDVSTKKELHLSLNSCFSMQGYDRKYISPLEDRLLLWRGGISKENQVTGKDIPINYVADSFFPSISEPDAYQRTVLHCDLGSNTHRMSFPNGEEKSTSQAEAGSSLMQQMDFCGRSNNGKSIEMQEHSALSKKHSDQRADNVSEQGVLDDIPMEIVELMAKNQYERCLPDVENNNQPSETTTNTSNTKIYAKEKLSFLLQESAHKPKSRAKNIRNGQIKRAESVGGTKRKAVDCFSPVDRGHHNLRQLEPNCAPNELRAYPQCQERPASGIKISDTNSSKPSSSQNGQWIGSAVGHKSSQTNLQTLGACNTYQSVPQQSKEAAHLWSPMIPNHMPFVYNISQKHADQSTNIDVPSHYPISLRKGNLNGNHDVNYLNISATNPEKHHRNSDSENLSKPHAEYPFACKHSGMGSLDLYSNETIPAMHLLSLMDAGLRSGAPIDGTPKFFKGPSFPHDHHSKDFSVLSSGGYKTSSTMKPSSYDYYGKSHLSENSHEYCPPIPTIGASVYSFNHGKGVKKITDFTGQAALRSQEKEKAKCFDSLSKSKGHGSQKSVLTTGGSGMNHGSIPFHGVQKMLLGTSDSMAFPLQYHVFENESKHKQEPCNTSSGVWPQKISSKTEKCSVNQNPADFSTPEAGNAYMIRGEDIKFRKPVFSQNRSGLIKLDRQKRQRKLTASKGKV